MKGKFNCITVNFDRTQHDIYLIQNFISYFVCAYDKSLLVQVISLAFMWEHLCKAHSALLDLLKGDTNEIASINKSFWAEIHQALLLQFYNG